MLEDVSQVLTAWRRTFLHRLAARCQYQICSSKAFSIIVEYILIMKYSDLPVHLCRPEQSICQIQKGNPKNHGEKSCSFNSTIFPYFDNPLVFVRHWWVGRFRVFSVLFRSNL